jgi:hypothetical protein
MTSMSGQYAAAADEGGDRLPPPSAQNQEVILDAWRQVLGQVLRTRDDEWKEQLRVIKAESLATVAQLRANAAEICGRLEQRISERLAQIGQPEDGREGPPGERGEKGDKGEPGELPVVRAWTEDDVSYAGDVVTCDGGTWQARKDTSKKPPHGDWTPLALPGRDAAFPVIKGTYREGETYGFLNIVALNGSSFIARRDDPGPCPGDGWQLIASAGRPGKPGMKGERGEPGQRGERGLPGLNIQNWNLEPEKYLLTPMMADSHEGPAANLRPFFERYDEERNA